MSHKALLLALALVAAPGLAQPNSVAQAIEAGQVGERFDGYLGFASTPSPEVRRQVQSINIQRRNLYTQLAERRGVTPDLVGKATACQLFSQLFSGEPYLLDGGTWRRYTSKESAPVPQHCR